MTSYDSVTRRADRIDANMLAILHFQPATEAYTIAAETHARINRARQEAEDGRIHTADNLLDVAQMDANRASTQSIDETRRSL